MHNKLIKVHELLYRIPYAWHGLLKSKYPLPSCGNSLKLNARIGRIGKVFTYIVCLPQVSLVGPPWRTEANSLQVENNVLSLTLSPLCLSLHPLLTFFASPSLFFLYLVVPLTFPTPPYVFLLSLRPSNLHFPPFPSSPSSCINFKSPLPLPPSLNLSLFTPPPLPVPPSLSPLCLSLYLLLTLSLSFTFSR